MFVSDLVLDEISGRKAAIDFETAVRGDPASVQYETKVMQQGTDSMYLKINCMLQCGVVLDDERTEEPSSHHMVEEIILAGLPDESLSGTYSGDKN